MTPTVRPAVAADAQAMADILNPLIAQGGTTAIAGHQTAADWRALAAGEGAGAIVHVAEAGGEVVGFQYLRPHPDLGPTELSIATFARLGGARRGVGRALFAASLAAARARGVTGISAVIRHVNAGGLRDYERMGFRDHADLGDRVDKRLTLRAAAGG
ncbi:MAG: GNAT family N-acetyltransferase [Paracoccaceae bacterium]